MNIVPTVLAARGQRVRGVLRTLSTVLVLSCLALGGCRPTMPERPGETEYKVKKIAFEGVRGGREDELRDVLATQENRFNPFEPKRYLNTYSLSSDIDRIETFYRHHGFFDARVIDQDVEYNEDREKVKITYKIFEGQPTVVTKIIYAMLDSNGRATRLTASESGIVDASSLREITVEDLLSKLDVIENARYSRPDMLADAEEMRRRLQEHSYARARVDARAYVDPSDRKATVVFVVDQGPACVWGNVYVDGNEKIPDELIVESIPVKPNQQQRYRQSMVRDTQRRLYDWNTFQRVLVETTVSRERRDSDDSLFDDISERDGFGAITPAMAAFFEEIEAELGATLGAEERAYAGPDGSGYLQAAVGGFDLGAVSVSDTSIDLYIEVQELPDSNYRFSIGQQIDSGRWETFFQASSVWRYIFRPLNRFEANFKLGYAWLPSPFSAWNSGELTNKGIVTRGQLRYIRPQLLFGIFDLSTGLRASRDVELNYNVRTFGGDVTLSHRPTDYFRYDFGYTLDLVTETSTVRDFRDTYRMGFLKVGAQLDFRDDLLQPKKGAFIGVEARLGEPYIGQFFFTSVTPDLRGYIPMGDRLTLGLRALAGWIFNFTRNDEIPQNYRYYGGGATDFRGLPYRRLSPYSYTVRNDDIQIVGNPFFDSAEECEAELNRLGITQDFTCEDEPTGGYFKALFSVEPRFEIGEDWLYGALFADFATVQRDVRPEFSLGDEGFHLAVGGGLRLATPVGPIRADVGYRITNSPNFSDIRAVTFYIAVGEAF